MTEPTSRRVAFEQARLSLARLHPSGESSRERGFANALRVSAMALGVERASLWCFERDDTELVCKGLFTLSDHGYTLSEDTLPCARIPAYVDGLRERRVIAAKDAQRHRLTHELTATYLAPRGISSLLDAPIIHDGRLVGVVCHEHVGAQREFEQHEVDFAGSVADIIALIMEQSARIALERQLRIEEERNQRNVKLEAVARLARTAAHDFNNVLTSILVWAEQLQASNDPEIRHKAQAILEAGEMGARISRELLVLGRDGPAAPIRVDVRNALTGVLALLRARFGAELEVRITQTLDEAFVLADPSQIERVVLNLCANGCEAMGGRGVLSVTVRAPQKHEAPTRGYVVLEVADNGPGLSSEALAHLYEPYFTTKAGGHGLGLASVHGIVKQLKGRVSAENPALGGARFVVLLPRAS